MGLPEYGLATPSPVEQSYSLRLYVAGQTPKSVQAFTERVLVGLDLRVRH